jgi:hypothetical protein
MLSADFKEHITEKTGSGANLPKVKKISKWPLLNSINIGRAAKKKRRFLHVVVYSHLNI